MENPGSWGGAGTAAVPPVSGVRTGGGCRLAVQPPGEKVQLPHSAGDLLPGCPLSAPRPRPLSTLAREVPSTGLSPKVRAKATGFSFCVQVSLRVLGFWGWSATTDHWSFLDCRL